MSENQFYYMDLLGPLYRSTVYPKPLAIEWLKHYRKTADGEWHLYQVWLNDLGDEERRVEILPY